MGWRRRERTFPPDTHPWIEEQEGLSATSSQYLIESFRGEGERTAGGERGGGRRGELLYMLYMTIKRRKGKSKMEISRNRRRSSRIRRNKKTMKKGMMKMTRSSRRKL